MFAGPNGSGKSTIRRVVPRELQGIYLNPDEIEKKAKGVGYFDPGDFGVEASPQGIRSFFEASTLLRTAGLLSLVDKIDFEDNRISLPVQEMNSYIASVFSDFLRHELLKLGESFTFETVMSSGDKVEFLRTAHSLGYRNYLYYVATEDPEINVARVQARVALGGHSVPEDKIASRYLRSLNLLYDAIQASDRAYIFDNSANGREDLLWIAEVTDGLVLELKTDSVPVWFKQAVLDKASFDKRAT
jgi:predicted ABC-type ATPase